MKYVKKKHIKEFFNNNDKKCSHDVIEELDKKIEELLKNAIYRATMNGRITLKKQDL